MDIFKRRGISREDIFLVFSACVFPVFLWAFYHLLNKIPSFILRLNVSELIGASAYILGFALIESILFFLVLFLIIYLIALILPKKLFADHLVAISNMLALVVSALAIYIQLNYDKIPLLGKRRILLGLGLVGLGFLIYYFLILRFPRLENAIRAVVRRVSVLSVIYAVFGCLSILVVIIRNL